MTDVPSPPSSAGAVLSAALRLIRTRRGLSVLQVAEAMNMAPRTYQRFEAGVTRLNFDHIQRFARATRSDVHAILMAVAIRSPELAWRAADNQLGSVFAVTLERFNSAYGDRILDLDVRTVVAAITEMFDKLGMAADATTEARKWLQDAPEKSEAPATPRKPSTSR